MTIDPRFPIGKFQSAESFSAAERIAFLDRIASLPGRLEAAIQGLTAAQLDTPYREGGWTVRQVVHHVADSHMNAYIRVKWTLTEDQPVIKAYLEKECANTPEIKADPAISVAILKALHARWVLLLQSLSEQQLGRQFVHPESKKSVSIAQLMGLYAWHGDHHLAHITELKKLRNW